LFADLLGGADCFLLMYCRQPPINLEKAQSKHQSAPCAKKNPRARRQKICVGDGGKMLERIRTFFGKLIGAHADKQTVVVVGSAWTCTKCKFVFLTKREGEKHDCAEIYRDSI